MRYLIIALSFFSITELFAGDPDRLEVRLISENNLCDDNLSPTGAAYAVIIEDNGKEDSNLKDYTVNWYTGTSASGTPAYVGPTYDQMAAGTYTVKILHDKSSFTDQVIVTIDRTQEGPDAYVDEVKNAKNCKENDGRAKVRVRADFPQEGENHSHDDIKDCKHGICWTFVWYEGNNPFIGDVVAVGADAKNLKPGTYAVVVTNESTGCQTVVSLSVGLDAEVPEVGGTVVANITDCAEPNAGELSAFTNGSKNNNKFEFDWYIGDFVKEAPDYNNLETITGLAAGNYTLVATEKGSGCPSNPITLTVEDLTSVPLIAVNLDLEQTSCNASTPNGAVSATADGTTSGYDFEWFEGQNTLDENLIGTSSSISGLAAGFYTVRATNTSDPNSQNCFSTAEIEVTENLTYPTPVNASVTDQTYCVNPNGSIAANIAGNTTGFSFYWFDGNISSPDINNPDFTGATYGSLQSGDYTLVVVNDNTSCASDPQVFTVDDLTSIPVIALASSTELTSCESPNGSISVTADGGVSGFAFRWFNGSSTASSDEVTPSPGADITGLTAGTYTVLVVNQTSGCSETFEHTVLDSRVTPVPATTIIDQTQCDPINGEIQANVGGVTAGYNFYWFDGNIASPDISSSDRSGATITGLTAGEYTLVVEDDVTKCVSAAQVLTVDDLTPIISGSISLVADQTSCDAAAPNGALSVSASGGSSYTFEWFAGTDATGSSFASGSSVSGLSAQSYTVLITDASGCTAEVTAAVSSAIVLPEIDIDNIIANSVCDPSLTSPAITNNGQIASSIGGTTAGYTFYWFDGDIASPDITSPDFTGDTYSNLASGDYTLVVVEDATTCESDRLVVTVPDATPTIGGTITLDAAQTSCDPTAPNGELTVVASGGSGPYSYAWYPGTDTSDPTDIIATTANAGGLSAQTYTVVITDQSNGCSEEVSYTLPSNIQLPDIDIDNVISNSVCNTSTGASFNGEIESSIGGTTAGYTFYWFDGDIASPDITAPDFTGDTYSNLASGDYTVVVVEDATTCESDRLVVSVPDATPTIGGTITLDAAQTSCDAAAPNGELTVVASGGTGPYTYAWYPGTDTSDPTDIIATTANATGLSAQTYTVVITDQSNGCSEEVSYTLPSNIQLPDIDIDNVISNSVCNTSTGASFNGEIESSIGGITAGYTFYWFDGDVASPDITSPDFTGSTYSNLASGDYTIVVVEDATTCASDRFVVTVPDATPTIGGTITLDAAQTSCDTSAPNGALTASGSGGTSYTYKWYPGTDTSDPTDIIVSTANISGLGAQTYTVVITDQATGCQEEVSYALPSDIQLPAIDVDNIVPNSICDPALSTAADYNGEIEASVGGNTADYTFYWFDGDVASPDISSPDFTGSTYSNLASGDYTIVVVEDATTCESDRLVVTVPDATPTIDGTITLDGAQTSCDPTAPNGELTAAGSGGTTYTYDWYPGTDTSDPTDIIVSTANISGLGAQTYTVVITDQATGCQEEVSYALPTDIQLPAIDVDNIVPNSICDPALSTAADYNGEIEASVGGNTADYTFYWFDGDVVSPDITSPDFTGSTYSNLASGDYTIVVVEDATTCASDRLVVTVPDATPTIGGTITLDAAQTSCDPTAPNGELTAAGSGGTTYTYEWYPGTDTSDPTDIIVSTANISGLGAQTYTVVITDQATGCQEEVSYALPTDIQLPAIDVDNIVPNSICDPALSTAADYNGEIEASVGGNTADYTFYWFDGDVASPDITSPDFTGSTYSNLASGDYTIVVVEDATTCASDRLVVTVPDATPTIGGTITLDAAQTSCDPTAPNGELTAAGSGGTSYTYEWYPGIDTSDPTDIIVSTANISGLGAQTYTVVITDQASGCQEEVSYAVPNDIKKPIINIDPNADITPNSICDPALATATDYNGVIAANVTYDGAAITVADYRFDWYIGNDTSGAADFSSVGANNYTNLAPGEYSLIVTRTNAGPGFQCSSEPITVTVPNNTTTPTATISKDAPQTSCGVPNGQLTAAGASGSGSYAYEWFVGTDTSTPFVDGTDGTISAAPGATISGIDAGNYTVRVIDLATGCQTTQNIYLDENIIDPVVTLAVTTAMTDCSFDGVITPTITSTNAAPSGHNYTWYAGTDTSAPEVATTTDAGAANPELSTSNTGSTIYSGYYTVVATDIYTGCISGTETIFLDRPSPLFTILTDVNVLPSDCGLDEGIVTAWVDLDGNTDPSIAETAPYTFEWFLGNPTDLAANYYTNPEPAFVPNSNALIDQNGVYPGSIPASAGLNNVDYFGPDNATQGATFFGRESGQYTVVVTNASGCKEFVGVDIGFNNGAEVIVADVAISETNSCASPNGSLEVTDLANIPGGQDFDDYYYNWYEGTNEDVGNEIVDAGGSVVTTALLNQNGAVMGLDPDYYTVVPVESFGSLCRLTPYTVFLDSAYRQPEIAATILDHSTSCFGNGAITVLGSKDADDSTPAAATPYSYLWNTGATTAAISGLSPGDYTVNVTDNQTSCSKSETYTIRDERVIPNISNISSEAQSYCNANGTLTILDGDINPGNTGDYDFNVFLNGTEAADLIAPTQTAIAGGVEFSGLEAGTYYISATRVTTGDGEGCTSGFIQETVADELDPVVLTLSQEENTSCDPATNSDASIELTMSTPSSNGGISGATYNITVDNQPGTTLGDQVGVTSPFEYGADIVGNGEIVLPGSYTFTIQNTVSGCTTTRSITVEDNPEPIDFSRSNLLVRGAEYCIPSGSIIVDNILPADTSDYTYTWYAGKTNYDAGTPIAGVTRSVLDSTKYPSIGAGVYYVVATRGAGIDPGSSCSSVGVRVEMPNAQVTPALTLSQTANTACDADPNSDATLTLNMNTSGSSYAPIRDANYDIRFVSKPAGATVADTLDINSTITFVSKPSRIITTGVYEIEITNKESKCTVTRSITVEDNPEPIDFGRNNLIVRGAEYCIPSGSIVVDNILPADTSDYTYTWYAGKSNYDAGTPIAGVTRSVLDSTKYPSIGAGVYYVVATRGSGIDPGSSCSSVGVRVEMPNAQETPALTLSQTANTACDADPNSDATITLNMNTSGSSYAPIRDANYDIRFASKPAGATVADTLDINSTITFVSKPSRIITPGVYEIEITNRESKCTVTRSITVEDNPEPIDFGRNNLIVRGAEYCIPSGSIIVDNILPADTSDYTYTWYAGKSNYDAGTPIAGVTRSVLDSTKYPSIGAGVYYVVATRGVGIDPGSSCSSVGVRVEIPNAQVTPALTLSQTANTACDADPNSDATLTLNMNTSGSSYAPIRDANYDIRFVSKPAGATVADTLDINSTITFVSKPSRIITPGVYEIEITNRESKCTVTRSITVEDNPEPIDFGRNNLIVRGAEYCIPSGSIIVDNILPADTSDYTYTWYAGKSNYDAGTPIAGVTRSVLDSTKYPSIGAGVYYVVATRGVGIDPGSSCSSVGVRVEIPNAQVTPALTLSQTANTACDADPNSDATLTLNMNTSGSSYAPIRDANYDIRFVSKPAGATVADTLDINSTITFVSKPSRIITPGVYEIEITNRESQCTVTRSITVEDNPEPIDFGRNNLIVRGAEYCIPSGSIIVDNILPADTSDYTYTWYAGKSNYDAGTPIAGVTRSVLDSTKYPSIGAGVYYVVATRGVGIDPGSSCSSVGVRVEIPNVQVTPALTLSQTANTACDADPNSDATITLNMNTSGSSYAPIRDANYDIRFVSKPAGATVADTLDINSTITFVSKPSRIITPGVYEIEITNRESQCTVTRSITVEDNPEPINFSRSNLLVRGAEYCIPSGSIIVDNILPADTSDYTYTWYAGKSNYDAGTPIAGVTKSVLDSTKYPSIGAGVYYVVATRGVGIDPGSSCSSVGVRVEIPNAQVTPGLTLSQTANTACDADPNSDATLTLNMNTSGSSYAPIRDANYDIRFASKPAGATVADTLDINSTITFVSKPSRIITPGVYEIEITNRESKCTVTRSITVEDNPEPIDFGRNNLIVRGAEYCIPSGSIVVDNILPADTSDYTYTWYAGKSNYDAGTPIAGVTRSVLDSTKYPSIGAGVYYVVATRGVGIDPGSSCSSVGVRVEIPNAQVTPGLTLSQTANTACDADPNSDATITLNMNTSGSSYAPIRDANYDIRFVSKPAGATVADTLDINSTITFVSKPSRIITPGVYEIEITNRESKCTVTRSITVEDNPEPIILRKADLTVVNSTSCSPSGNITVNNISPNTPSGLSDYSFTWYDGEANYTSNSPIAGVTGTELDSSKYSSIHPGVYFVVATRDNGVNPGSSCTSIAVSVEILDASISPDIVIVENAPNSSCDPANPNGSLSASVNGENLTDFTYEWFIGLNNTTDNVNATLISGAAGETVSGLAAGNYTVRVTDNTSPGEACINTESFYLTEDFTISVAKNVIFDITPQSDCFDSGSITVASLTPGNPADFIYEWYYGTYDASGLISGQNSASISGRPAGTYYVMIRNSATECETETPIEVEIPFTATSPVIELLDAKPNTDCNPNTPDGFLEVGADFGQTAGYSFAWYDGEMPVNSGAAMIGNGNRINQLDSGYYSVVVQSSATNCSDTAQFYVEFLPELPKISLTTSPVTSCASANGSAYAQIYNLEGNFEFNWYIGNTITNQPDFTGPWQRDLPVGDYIVEAIDLDAPDCVSEPVSFSIEELIEVPQLKLNQISPNTYCDPEKVNGVAEVILYYVDEDDDTDTVFVTSDFEVLWYRETSFPEGTADFAGRINSQLAAADYTVTYRNVSSNCMWQDNITITEDLTVVPRPVVTITELFDSCEEPNGAAEISSSALNPSYVYRWYHEELNETPDFISNQVEELDLGIYLVTATDTVSGCISEPTEIEITDGRVAPEISLSLEPELCGEYNGKAIISINEDYEYRSIEWETPYGPAYGTSYDEFTSGQYSVTVTGSNGCQYTKDFTITSEINVFNGVSPNNDGENDVWEIGCIGGYEENRVEIYNRAGALVFSTEGYGISSNDFEGYGNRGVYAGEKKLPDGTYYYVIVKGDGSEAVTGYLELFR